MAQVQDERLPKESAWEPVEISPIVIIFICKTNHELMEDAVKGIVLFLAFLGIYFFLQIYLLPKMGIST